MEKYFSEISIWLGGSITTGVKLDGMIGATRMIIIATKDRRYSREGNFTNTFVHTVGVLEYRGLQI